MMQRREHFAFSFENPPLLVGMHVAGALRDIPAPPVFGSATTCFASSFPTHALRTAGCPYQKVLPVFAQA